MIPRMIQQPACTDGWCTCAHKCILGLTTGLYLKLFLLSLIWQMNMSHTTVFLIYLKKTNGFSFILHLIICGGFIQINIRNKMGGQRERERERERERGNIWYNGFYLVTTQGKRRRRRRRKWGEGEEEKEEEKKKKNVRRRRRKRGEEEQEKKRKKKKKKKRKNSGNVGPIKKKTQFKEK